MANPIYNTLSASSLKGYLNHAISELQKGEDILLVKTLTGGPSDSYRLKSRSKINAAAIKTLESMVNNAKLTVEEYKRL